MLHQFLFATHIINIIIYLFVYTHSCYIRSTIKLYYIFYSIHKHNLHTPLEGEIGQGNLDGVFSRPTGFFVML